MVTLIYGRGGLPFGTKNFTSMLFLSIAIIVFLILSHLDEQVEPSLVVFFFDKFLQPSNKKKGLANPTKGFLRFVL
jgi:hypothetical protein